MIWCMVVQSRSKASGIVEAGNNESRPCMALVKVEQTFYSRVDPIMYSVDVNWVCVRFSKQAIRLCQQC